MKKIVIVTRTMIYGGIEKSLISMLEVLPKDEFDITVLLMEYRGGLLSEIPKWVKVKSLYGETISIKDQVLSNIKKLNLKKAATQIFYGIRCKKSNNVFEKYEYSSRVLGMLDGEYDLAIADHVPASFPVMYVVNNIKAKKKVAWIHSDVSLYKKELDLYKKYYDKYDRVFSVSIEAANKFRNMYPDLQEKVEVFYNIISRKKLLNLSKLDNGFDDEFTGVRILTVGRLCEQKGQDIIPNIVNKLKKDGYCFRWYCIGDGEYRTLLEEKINILNIKNEMVLLGNKMNPYPFFQECNIYVQPSRHECYCTTVVEAKCFSKPMVITNFNGANEQIKSEVNGIISEFNEKEIYLNIKRLLESEELKSNFESKLKLEKVDTFSEIDKLFNLVK